MIKDQSFMREGIIWKLMFVKVAMISRSTRREACRQSCYPWQKLRQDQLQRCRSLADSSSHVFFVSHSWSLASLSCSIIYLDHREVTEWEDFFLLYLYGKLL
ncbi:unnamed protein product [Musa acuminata var. zebrina]